MTSQFPRKANSLDCVGIWFSRHLPDDWRPERYRGGLMLNERQYKALCAVVPADLPKGEEKISEGDVQRFGTKG